MNRDSFVFYASFYEAIKELPRDVQGEIYTAIMEYSLYGKETDSLKQIAKAVFTLIKPQLDANNKRYESGKKGGRPPRELNQDQTKDKPNHNQEETKSKPNVNDNDNVNDNVNDSIGNKLPICEPEPHDEKIHIDYKALVSFYNEKTKGIFGSIKYPLSEKRKKFIKARITEHGKEEFMNAIIGISTNEYLRGVAWFNFDWMIKPTNFEKLISGNYDNKNRGCDKKGERIDLSQHIAEGLSRSSLDKQQRRE